MKKFITPLFYIGNLLAIIGIAINTKYEFGPYFTVIGGTMAALAQLNSPYKGGNKNIKRLLRQQTFASIFFIASGASMLYLHNNEWIMFASIAAVLYLYTAFRIPIEEKKENQK